MTTEAPRPVVPVAQQALFSAPKPVGPVYSHEQVVERAMAHWRSAGFPYYDLTVAECMDAINRLALSEDQALMGTNEAYHVADTWHRQRFESSAAGMRSPLEAFHDDALLARTLGLLLRYGQPLTGSQLLGKLAIVSGTQACSNFRPGFALAIYRRFAQPGAAILDTSSGYGGRLVGWMASGLGGRYLGIDPSLRACSANLEMAAALGFASQVVQINAPAEDVPHELVAGQFDLAFTSPPYFTKERYAALDEDAGRQSWSRYPTEATWRAGFLEPLLALQYAALKPGGVAVLNVQDVQLGAKVHQLTEWTKHAAVAAGFRRDETDETTQLQLTRRFGANVGAEVSSEPLYVFRKGPR